MKQRHAWMLCALLLALRRLRLHRRPTGATAARILPAVT